MSASAANATCSSAHGDIRDPGRERENEGSGPGQTPNGPFARGKGAQLAVGHKRIPDVRVVGLLLRPAVVPELYPIAGIAEEAEREVVADQFRHSAEVPVFAKGCHLVAFVRPPSVPDGPSHLDAVQGHTGRNHRGGILRLARDVAFVEGLITARADRFDDGKFGILPRVGWRGGMLEGGQERREPHRWARDGVLGLRQLARHAGLGDVRDDAGADQGGGTGEDGRAEARGVLPRL